MSHYCAISNEHKLLTVSVSNTENHRAAFPAMSYYNQNTGVSDSEMVAYMQSYQTIMLSSYEHFTIVFNHVILYCMDCAGGQTRAN